MPEFVRVNADVKTMFLPGQLKGLAGLRIHLDMKIGAGEFLIDSGADRPTLIPWMRIATGYVRSDGRMYSLPAVSAAPHDVNDPGELGVLVPADDPNFNLETPMAYHVTCELPVAGREVLFKEWDITVPSGETTVDLGGLTPGPAREVIGVPEFVSLDMVTGVGAAGKEVARAGSESAAQTAMGGTAIGKLLFTADDVAAVRAAIATLLGQLLMGAESDTAGREALIVPSDFDDGLSDSRKPINGSVSSLSLDAALAAFYSLVSAAITSPYFQALANGNVLNAHTAADATQKVSKWGTPHYENAEEPVYGLRVVADGSDNTVQIGGGSSTGNAGTKVEFYTAANNTTTTGTLRASIDSSGAFSMATGSSLNAFNTSDQTTNYEKGVFRYNSNVLELGHLFAGTGTSARVLKAGVAASAGGAIARYFQAQNAAPFLAAIWDATGITGNMVSVGNSSTCQASSGNQTALAVNPTVNQSGTAGYTGLAVNVTETGTGSGSNRLADYQVGGVSKSYVNNKGFVYGLNFVAATTFRATAAGITSLSIDSAGVQVFTGSTTQECRLPTTGVIAGQVYKVINQSTGDVTVKSSGANTIDTLTGASASAPVGHLYMALVDTPTTAAHWRAI